jgi:hypothetical protein
VHYGSCILILCERSVGRLVGRSVGRSVCRLVGCPVGRSVGWLVGRLVGWLVAWSVGRLVGWSTIRVPRLWGVPLQKDKSIGPVTFLLNNYSVFADKSTNAKVKADGWTDRKIIWIGVGKSKQGGPISLD